MSKSPLVVTLGRIARRAEPPPIDDGQVRRLIERAVRAEPLERRSRVWIAAVATVATVAAVAVAALGVWWVTPRRVSVPTVLEVTLPTGDHLVGVAGAKFEVEQVAPARRRIQLHGGTVMFDVAHVVAGQRFEVVTDQLVATATGTVFSVEADAKRSLVRVYEGIVEVEQAGEVHALIAGAVWDSATAQTEIVMVRPAALATSIDDALRDRARVIVLDRSEPPAPPHVADPVRRAPVATESARTGTRATASPPATSPTDQPTTPWSTDSVPVDKLSLDQLLATARAQLATGKLADALSTAQLAASRAPWSGPWWQVVADAQRGLGQLADAASSYDRVAHDLAGIDRSEAGYSAAYLRHHDLHDDAAALASLDASKADVAGSSLEERALGLRVQILVTLHRDARPTAKLYLARFPHADLRAYMLAVAK